MLGDPTYGITRTTTLDFATAVEKARQSLAAEGFGVLTEIDLSATLKKKLDHDMRPYLILGACHPPSARDAVQADGAIGLLLPCNVVVTTDDNGHAVVGAIDPRAMFGMVEAEGMDGVVAEVRARLTQALDNIG